MKPRRIIGSPDAGTCDAFKPSAPQARCGKPTVFVLLDALPSGATFATCFCAGHLRARVNVGLLRGRAS